MHPKRNATDLSVVIALMAEMGSLWKESGDKQTEKYAIRAVAEMREGRFSTEDLVELAYWAFDSGGGDIKLSLRRQYHSCLIRMIDELELLGIRNPKVSASREILMRWLDENKIYR